MKVFYSLSIFSILSFLLSCSEERISAPKPSKLFKKYEKSVVLIRSEYYYELKVDDETSFYFSNIEDGDFQNFTTSAEEAKQNVNVSFGTGFYVSKDGKIATNRHVVYHDIDEESVKDIYENKIQSLILEMEREVEEIQDDYSEAYRIYYNTDYYSTRQKADEAMDVLKAKYDEVQNTITVLNLISESDDFEFMTVSDLSVAENNTFVTETEDFKKCVLSKVSEEDEIDLAVIQLKSKKTPSNVKHIFTFKDQNPNIKNGTMEEGEGFSVDDILPIDHKVYMIGFNYGPSVGNTDDGLKAQLTQGTVTQESSGAQVLYSIPSLKGSSGSPVIDQWGNLAAINYAKVGEQGFNYGILSKHLKDLLEN